MFALLSSLSVPALVALLWRLVPWWSRSRGALQSDEVDRVIARLRLPMGPHTPSPEVLRTLLTPDDGQPLVLDAPALGPDATTQRAGRRHGCEVLPLGRGVRCRSRRDLIGWCFDPTVTPEGRAWLAKLLHARPSSATPVDAGAASALGVVGLIAIVSVAFTLVRAIGRRKA